MTAANRFTLQAEAEGSMTIPTQKAALRDQVESALEEYFSQLDGQPTNDLYQLVLEQIEAPLFTAVLNYTNGNQSKAASMLGLNRGTLRKKLKQYNLL
jgi:Fis family transcriptional regulator